MKTKKKILSHITEKQEESPEYVHSDYEISSWEDVDEIDEESPREELSETAKFEQRRL